MMRMMPKKNDGMPSPNSENMRTAWSAGRSWRAAARAASGTVMTTVNKVATAMSAAVTAACAAISELTETL